MNLTSTREELTELSTIGSLAIDDAFECFTLEDRVRPVKVEGSSAIPAGRDEVVVTFSERFQRPLPLPLNGPGFDGIRIHPGNTYVDTEGCILVGKTRAENAIGNSRAAFKTLFAKIDAASKVEKRFIEIRQADG